MGTLFGRLLAVPATAAGVVLLVAAGCGVDTDEDPRAIPRDNLPGRLVEEPTPAANTDLEGAERVKVYFLRDRGDEVSLVPVIRYVNAPATEGSILDALLLEEPTPEEREQGITTAIPSSTAQAEPPSLEDGGVLVVSLTQGLFQVQSDSLRNAYAQIVCTATARRPVQSVQFNVDGLPVAALGGNSQAVDRPLRCDDYEGLREEAEVEPVAASTTTAPAPAATAGPGTVAPAGTAPPTTAPPVATTTGADTVPPDPGLGERPGSPAFEPEEPETAL